MMESESINFTTGPQQKQQTFPDKDEGEKVIIEMSPMPREGSATTEATTDTTGTMETTSKDDKKKKTKKSSRRKKNSKKGSKRSKSKSMYRDPEGYTGNEVHHENPKEKRRSTISFSGSTRLGTLHNASQTQLPASASPVLDPYSQYGREESSEMLTSPFLDSGTASHRMSTTSYIHPRSMSVMDNGGGDPSNYFNTDAHQSLRLRDENSGRVIIDTEPTGLFHDTFSFLMTAQYPCEKQIKTKMEHLKKSCVVKGKMSNIMNNMPYGMNNNVDNNTPEVEIYEDEVVEKGAFTNNNTSKRETKKAKLKEEFQPKVEDYIPNVLLSPNAKKLLTVNSDDWYLPFFLGWLVILLQIFIYLIVFLNILRNGGEPPNADTLMRMAQIFALMVALYTQSDLVDAVFMLTEGTQHFRRITTKKKFYVSNMMRLGAGHLGIVASFVLVVYAVDVVELLLNFTAIEFVACLDNSVFELSSKGFLGISIEKKAKEIEQFRYQRIIRKSIAWKRLGVYLIYFAAYVGSYCIIIGLQNSRAIGVDNEVYVQFDDTEVPELFGISGAYIGCSGFTTRRNGRKYTTSVGYVDVSYHWSECPGLDEEEVFPDHAFYFCHDIKGWVYIQESTKDPCDKANHILRSYLSEGDRLPSDQYDILKHAGATWFVQQDDIQGEVALDEIFIESADPFSIAYNCTGPFNLLTDFEDLGTFRIGLWPLPNSYYPFFENEVPYFDKFSLVYRQVFFGALTDEEVLLSNVAPNCNDESQDTLAFLTIFFDGLRWHYMENFVPERFVDYARNKYPEEFDNFSSSERCPWKIFLRYYLRDIDWMFNETIVTPTYVSETMQLLTTKDTGGPTINLVWHEADVVYSREIIIPGRSTNDIGLNVDTECSIFSINCTDGELPFIMNVWTDRYPQETAVLVQRNPSLPLEPIGDYLEQMTGNVVNYYNNTKSVRVSGGRSVFTDFTIEENQVLDFRFRDRETRYGVETCVPYKKYFTFCMDVRVLNTKPLNTEAGETPEDVDLVEFDIGFVSSAVRSREGYGMDCALYHVCFLNDPTGFVEFAGFNFGPEECSYEEIKEMYPGIADRAVF